MIPRERLPARPHRVARLKKKKKKTPGLGLIRPVVQIPWCDTHFVQFKEEKLIQLGLFFLERNRNFVYRKDFGARRVT